MPNNHYPRWISCSVCGSLVFTTASHTTCQECRDEIAHNKRHHSLYKINESDAVIIFDPTPLEEGGFSRGARFNWEELECGMTKKCFIEGTIFDHKGIKKVVKKIGNSFRLVVYS